MTETLQNNGLKKLRNHARQARKDIVTMIHDSKDGHPSPSLSVVDILVYLYFESMTINPADPGWENRDRCILSKGHACPALYAVLARKGYFNPDELSGLRTIGSMLQGHPDMNKTPGIDSTSGSLGNGLGIGLGMVLANRLKEIESYTYVIAGDGELQEGVVWEAAMASVKFKANKLILFIDHNKMQSGGFVKDVSGLEPILPKFEAFGWNCLEIDGHDFFQLRSSVNEAKKSKDKPTVIICHTHKGQGIPFMVGDNSWHKRVPSEEELQLALNQIGDDE